MRKLILKLLREQDEEYYDMTPEEYLELLKLSGYEPSVTKIKKFGGKPIRITGSLSVNGLPISSLGNVARIEGSLDIGRTQIPDVENISIKGYVHDYGSRREARRKAAELRKKREENQERRESGEWDDLDNIDDEGIKAHALFKYLVENGEINEATEEEKAEYESIKEKLEELNLKYDSESLEPEEVSLLYDEISELEDRLEELAEMMNDVYVVYPMGYTHYGLSEFEVLGVDGLKGREYTVGTDDEMDDAVLKYAENYIDDVGSDGFNRGFLSDYIDDIDLRNWADDYYSSDVYDNPDFYFTEEDFTLTDEQESRKDELENYIEELDDYISDLEDQQNNLEDEIEDPDEYSEKYDELQSLIDDAESKKEKAQDEFDSIEPSNEPTDEMIQEKVNELVEDAVYDPIDFINNMGLELADFVDEKALAEGLVDSEGWGMMNSYDGNYDSVRVGNETYYIMRVN